MAALPMSDGGCGQLVVTVEEGDNAVFLAAVARIAATLVEADDEAVA